MATETQQPSTPAETQEQLPEHMQIKTDKVRTAGWKRFDTIVHFGISFGLNLTLALIQSVFQTNYDINKKIDLANENRDNADFLRENKLDGFVDQEKRKVGGLGGYFKFADWMLEKTNKLFGVKHGADGKTTTPERAMYSEIARDVLVLANAGHITTLLTQLFENKNVKPKMVRWLDKQIDENRIARGKAPTEAELREREAIYEKLDHELSGKSFLQVWTARAVGIATVIGSLIGLGKLDNLITKAKMDENAGLFRVRQAVVWTGRKMDKAGIAPKWLSNAVTENANTPETYFANRMLQLTATEIVGSGMTAAAQYFTLMFKEFFGKKNSAAANETKTEQPSTTNAKRPEAVPVKEDAKEKKDAAIEAATTGKARDEAQKDEEFARKAAVNTEEYRKKTTYQKSEDYRTALSTSNAEAHTLAGVS